MSLSTKSEYRGFRLITTVNPLPPPGGYCGHVLIEDQNGAIVAQRGTARLSLFCSAEAKALHLGQEAIDSEIAKLASASSQVPSNT